MILLIKLAHTFSKIVYVWVFCLHVRLCTTYMPSAQAGLKSASDPLSPKLYIAVSYHVGPWNWFQVLLKSARALNSWTISLGPYAHFLCVLALYKSQPAPLCHIHLRVLVAFSPHQSPLFHYLVACLVFLHLAFTSHQFDFYIFYLVILFWTEIFIFLLSALICSGDKPWLALHWALVTKMGRI